MGDIAEMAASVHVILGKAGVVPRAVAQMAGYWSMSAVEVFLPLHGNPRFAGGK